MKYSITIITCLIYSTLFGQIELNTGFGVNKDLAAGVILNVGYDYFPNKMISTKTQLGFKSLVNKKDFVATKINVSIYEIHQTVSFKILNYKKYTLNPNIGLSYRVTNGKLDISPPLNTPNIRTVRIDYGRNETVRVRNITGENIRRYSTNNLGYCIQLQNQFQLSKKLTLLITPFVEPDIDRSQNVGGCYVGVLLIK